MRVRFSLYPLLFADLLSKVKGSQPMCLHSSVSHRCFHLFPHNFSVYFLMQTVSPGTSLRTSLFHAARPSRTFTVTISLRSTRELKRRHINATNVPSESCENMRSVEIEGTQPRSSRMSDFLCTGAPPIVRSREAFTSEA
jgi:hypothetical protein